MNNFWDRLDRSGGESACWTWTGKMNGKYGYVMVNGKAVGTHRVAWSLVNGEIAPGLFICHRCDNPPCCNPAHLFIGTSRDNNRDMTEKGRQVPPSGDKHWARIRPGAQVGNSNFNAKLTADDVEQIKNWMVAGLSNSRIAKAYGLSVSTISLISNGVNWASVPWPDGACFSVNDARGKRSRGVRRSKLQKNGGVCIKVGCDVPTTGARTLCDPCWVARRKESKTEHARRVRDEAWKKRAA